MISTAPQRRAQRSAASAEDPFAELIPYARLAASPALSSHSRHSRRNKWPAVISALRNQALAWHAQAVGQVQALRQQIGNLQLEVEELKNCRRSRRSRSHNGLAV